MLLEEARNSASISRYFNWPLIDSSYVDFGGVRIPIAFNRPTASGPSSSNPRSVVASVCPHIQVRIEDVVAIHSGGYDVLSTVPRTIVEIEALMAQGPLPRPLD